MLDEPEFHHLEAGIVLQAYLPDSHAVLEHLGEWAGRASPQGGAGIKIRIVKGANLAMESVEAELHDWIAAPYPTKADVDASYKLMLESALRPEWNGAVRVGVASHNLFDVAWALGAARSPSRRISAVASSWRCSRAWRPRRAAPFARWPARLLLYAPVVQHDEIDASIAYLARRLDENTAPENFLRALFTITPGSPEFAEQAERFRRAVARSPSTSQPHDGDSPAPPHGPRRSATSPTAIRPITITAGGSQRRGASTTATAPEPTLIETVAGIDEIVATAVAAQPHVVGRRRRRSGGRCSQRLPTCFAANVSTRSR